MVQQMVESLLVALSSLTDEMLQIDLTVEAELERLLSIQDLQSNLRAKIDELPAQQRENAFQLKSIRQLCEDCLKADQALNEKMQLFRLDILEQINIIKNAHKVKNSYQINYPTAGGFFVDKHQ
jgi:hypothetical protein